LATTTTNTLGRMEFLTSNGRFKSTHLDENTHLDFFLFNNFIQPKLKQAE